MGAYKNLLHNHATMNLAQKRDQFKQERVNYIMEL